MSVTATGLVPFRAVISSNRPDRQNDIITTGAVLRAMRRWTRMGKSVPLTWMHPIRPGRPEDQVGLILPASAVALGDEVLVKGFIDTSTTTGRRILAAAKAGGRIGFSLRYMAVPTTPGGWLRCGRPRRSGRRPH